MHKLAESESLDRESIEVLMHRFGNSASEALLDAQSKFFSCPEIEGVIGYFVEAGCAVSFGDPICSGEARAPLVESFHKFCKEKNLKIIYLIASEEFAKWCLQQKLSEVSIGVGEVLVFDPQKDPKEGPSGNRLRNKISHATSMGLRVHEYTEQNEEIECSIKKAGDAWLKGRKGPQIHLGDLNFFDLRNSRRWFYVEDGVEVIGAALLSKMEARDGWLLKFFITVPDSPRGASELLMISMLECLRKESCRFLTYGLVPGNALEEIIGLDRFSTWAAKKAFSLAKWIFKLGQRKIYWQKFHPNTEKAYVLFSDARIGLKQIKALSKALKIDLS